MKSEQSNLSARLVRVADTQPETERPRLLATLRIGAELALARIHEVGGGYPGVKDITAVELELLDTQPATEPAPPSEATAEAESAAPVPLAEESTL